MLQSRRGRTHILRVSESWYSPRCCMQAWSAKGHLGPDTDAFSHWSASFWPGFGLEFFPHCFSSVSLLGNANGVTSCYHFNTSPSLRSALLIMVTTQGLLNTCSVLSATGELNFQFYFIVIHLHLKNELLKNIFPIKYDFIAFMGLQSTLTTENLVYGWDWAVSIKHTWNLKTVGKEGELSTG